MGLMPDIYDEADDYRKACGERYEKIQELEAENKRLREALQRIWDGGGTPKSDFYHKIAKQALKGDKL